MASELAKILDHLYGAMEPIAVRFVRPVIEGDGSVQVLADAAASMKGLSAVSPEESEEDAQALAELAEDLELTVGALAGLASDDQPLPEDLSVTLDDVVKARARQFTRMLVNPWARWVVERTPRTVQRPVLQLDTHLRPWDPDGHAQFDEDWGEIAAMHAGTLTGVFDVMAEFGRALLHGNALVRLPGDTVLLNSSDSALERPLYLAATRENLLAMVKDLRAERAPEVAAAAAGTWIRAASARAKEAGDVVVMSPAMVPAMVADASPGLVSLVSAAQYAVCAYVQAHQVQATLAPNLRVSPVQEGTATKAEFLCKVEFLGEVSSDDSGHPPEWLAEDLERRIAGLTAPGLFDQLG